MDPAYFDSSTHQVVPSGIGDVLMPGDDDKLTVTMSADPVVMKAKQDITTDSVVLMQGTEAEVTAALRAFHRHPSKI